MSEGHQEALARLKFGAEMRKGLMVLTGDIGSGKTTIIFTFVRNRSETQHAAVIVNPRIVARNFLQKVCKQFSIELDFEECSKADTLNILSEYILKRSFNDSFSSFSFG